MQKIDRLGWAAGTCFVSFGVRLGIRVNEPEVLLRIPQYLPPGVRPAKSKDRVNESDRRDVTPPEFGPTFQISTKDAGESRFALGELGGRSRFQ